MKGARIRTLIAAAVSLILCVSAFAQEVVLEEPFTDPYTEAYEIWGTADPFNRVEAFDGNLELEGSFGFEAFGVYFIQELDLDDGPMTISFDMVRNSSNEGSEICVWFVNQYLIDGDPWTEGDFVRIGFFSDRDGVGSNALIVQETSPEMRGMGNQIAGVGEAFVMGEKFAVEWTLGTESYSIRIDGEQVAEGSHSLPGTSGFLMVHDWNSLEGDIDLISNLTVTQ